MAKGSAFGAVSPGFYNHVVAVRLRVQGSGNLQMKFYSLDDVREYPLGVFVMAARPGREPDRICNVPYEQRVFFEVKTTEIDEIFRINKIAFFIKPMASQLPG